MGFTISFGVSKSQPTPIVLEGLLKSGIAAEKSSWTEVQYVRFALKADMCSATQYVR